MLCQQEVIHLQPPPVLEAGPTLGELQELLSLLNPVGSTDSGSEGLNRSTCSVDERKRRRMISNRDSARRSRLRKKRLVEDLTEQLNRLTLENRELKNRLTQIVSRYHVVGRENERLRSECIALAARLSDLYRISISNME